MTHTKEKPTAEKTMDLEHEPYDDGDDFQCCDECNLRFCSKSENGANRKPKNHSSQYKGVHYCNHNKRWVAKIKKNNIVKGLGGFISEIEAAKAYNKAAVELHGEFASLNSIEV